jgi:hypothetical protein
VIDKLDVRILADAPFHPEFSKLFQELRYDPEKDPFRPSRHYALVADLRPYDYDAILHMSFKWGKYGNHKLELIDTGMMPFSRLVNEVERIFQVDAMRLGIMRVDLAVDVKGVPVPWFQARVKANHKQCIANFGSAEFVEMGKSGIQTLYFGKRPNLYRIYDKTAELKQQYAKQLRKLPTGQERPRFEELYGIPEQGYVLTRVERQIGGKIPDALATVAGLRNLDNFRPFEKLRVLTGGEAEPNPDEHTFMEYCTGMYLRERAQREGMHPTLKFISQHSKRNTKWVLDKFAEFLPEEHAEQFINTAYLDESFRRSVMRQLAA